jgi:hypothetical protein
MGVADTLGAMVKAFPQAQLVAFADLSSSMILMTQGKAELTQEHLDRLCQQAKAALDDPLAGLALQAFGEPNTAIVMGQAGLRVFLRSESEPADALCCICDPGIDLSAFVASARETLEEISGGS